jgi:hypothetical protein
VVEGAKGATVPLDQVVLESFFDPDDVRMEESVIAVKANMRSG